MYSIHNQSFGLFLLVSLCHAPTGQFVTVNPGFGGMLHQIGLLRGGELVELLDTYDTPDDLHRDFSTTYKGAKLSPFPNMTQSGRYAFGGKTHQLPLNWPADGHAIHGFVADKPFAMTDQTAPANRAALTVSHEHTGHETGFPFPFRLTIRYELTAETGLAVHTTVANTGSAPMPYGDGWHPYFRLANSVNDLHLRLLSDIIIEVDSTFIPTGNTMYLPDFLESTLIGNRVIDTYFVLRTGAGRAVTELENRPTHTRLSVWQDTEPGQYNYLQIYTPPDRLVLAIEPMSCPPNALNSGQSLLHLNPNDEFSASFGVFITQTDTCP